MPPFTFLRRNRARRTIIILIGVYGALIGLVVVFHASLWLIGVLALATVPALWDIARDTTAGLSLSDAGLSWHSGRKDGHILLKDIDFLRFDTRWDFSVRVTVTLTSGKQIRLPDESTPPHKQFEELLQQAGFRVERHHFTVF